MLATQTATVNVANTANREVGVAGWGSFCPEIPNKIAILDWIGQSRNLASLQALSETDHLEAASGLTKRELKKLDRFSVLAIAAARAAIASSQINPEQRAECGVVTGNMLGGWTFTEPQLRNLHRLGLSEVSPYLATAWFPAAPQGQITIHFGMKGFSKTISTDRCAGAQAIGLAFELICNGVCNSLLAGGTEAPCTPFVEAAPSAIWTGKGRLTEGAAYLLLSPYDETNVVIAGHATCAMRVNHSAFPSRLRSMLSTLYSTSSPSRPPELLVCNIPAIAALRNEVISCVQAFHGDVAGKIVFPTDLLGDCLGASGAISAVLACEQLQQSFSGNSALLMSIGHQCCDLLLFKRT